MSPIHHHKGEADLRNHHVSHCAPFAVNAIFFVDVDAVQETITYGYNQEANDDGVDGKTLTVDRARAIFRESRKVVFDGKIKWVK